MPFGNFPVGKFSEECLLNRHPLVRCKPGKRLVEALGLDAQDDLGQNVGVRERMQGFLCSNVARSPLDGLLAELVDGRVANDGQEPGPKRAPV